MIFDEMLRECAVALDDMKLTPKVEQRDSDRAIEAIHFFDERGCELTVYIEIGPYNDSLIGTLACYWDYAETITKAGDLFRIEKTLETTKVETYVQLCNILWAHRYQFKSKLKPGVREYHDEDLLALILELERLRIPHELQIVNQRPRISFSRNDQEIASVRKSAGRLRYQDTGGVVTSSQGTEGADLKEFIVHVTGDLSPKAVEIKKIR